MERQGFSPLNLGRPFPSGGGTRKAHLLLPACSFLQQNDGRTDEHPLGHFCSEGKLPGQRCLCHKCFLLLRWGPRFCLRMFARVPEAPEPRVLFPFSRYACCVESSRGVSLAVGHRWDMAGPHTVGRQCGAGEALGRPVDKTCKNPAHHRGQVTPSPLRFRPHGAGLVVAGAF